MKILVAHPPEDVVTAEVVGAACRRSFTPAQVEVAAYPSIRGDYPAAVLVEPGDAQADLVRQYREAGRKAVVLGKPGGRVAPLLGLRPLPRPTLAELAEEVGGPVPWGECAWRARYEPATVFGAAAPLAVRPLWRFDFADEWNNLGYGRLLLDGSPWSVGGAFEADQAAALARLYRGDAPTPLAVAAALDLPAAAVLWYNRPVGPVDSLEWGLVERFLGEHRPDELVCFPYLAEVPDGFRAAVVARLDCDEAVASGRPLLEAYAAAGLPLSLAVTTGLPMGAADFSFVRDVLDAGGAVVSHSVRHLPDWGGSYAAAREEALASKAWLEAHMPAAGPVRFAVSPFHQNSPAAVRALADAGYRGFVGGIIANDPAYLLGRAGPVPFAPGLVSHSQQCMFHGDCWRRTGLAVYRQSLAQHAAGGAIFGCLDHPFSPRYQYGWADEAERVAAHAQFLRTVRELPGLWAPNLGDCLAFLCKRAAVEVAVTGAGRLHVAGPPRDALPAVAVRWKGEPVAA